MAVTRWNFDLTGDVSTSPLTYDDGLMAIGAHVLADLQLIRRWVTYPNDSSSGFTLVYLVGPNAGKVIVAYAFEQPVSRYALGIPG